MRKTEGYSIWLKEATTLVNNEIQALFVSMRSWPLKTSLKVICGETSILFADFLQTGYNSKLPNNPAKILVYFLTSQKSLMLVFYMLGFYMILLILTVIVLLMLYCLDVMP